MFDLLHILSEVTLPSCLRRGLLPLSRNTHSPLLAQAAVSRMPPAENKLYVAGKVLIYAHSLANLGLRGQGWYAVQVKPVGGSHCAISAAHVIDNEAPSFTKDLPNAALDATKGKFRFKPGKICYAKEQASINQALVLQLLYPAQLEFAQASCTLQFELLFSTANLTSDEAPNASTFKRLAKQQFKLAGVLAGCHEYCAVTFGKGHAALCSVGLHATPLGYVAHKAGSAPRPDVIGNPADENCYNADMLSCVTAALAAAASSAGNGNQTKAGDGAQDQSGESYSQLLIAGPLMSAQQALAQFLASLPKGGLPVAKLESMRSMASQLTAAKEGKQTDPNASSAALFAAAAKAAGTSTGSAAAAAATARQSCDGGSSESFHADLDAVVLEIPPPSSSTVLPVIAEVQLAGQQNPQQMQQETPAATCDAAQQVLAAYKLHSQLLAIDCAVLEWCLRMTGPVILRHLRMQWEGRQAAELSPWLLHTQAGTGTGTCASNSQQIANGDGKEWHPTAAAFAMAQYGNDSCANSDASCIVDSTCSATVSSTTNNNAMFSGSNVCSSRDQSTDSTAAKNKSKTSYRESAGSRRCRKLLKQGVGISLPRLYDPSWWKRPHRNPLLFVNDTLAQHPVSAGPATTSQPHGSLSTSGVHVVVFVHGFQGRATDLALVQANLLLLDPSLKCFCSSANEKCTMDSLSTMGQRLAAEVAEFVQPYVNSIFKPLVHLSFVAHSMGSLVVRAAMTDTALQPLVPKLWMMLSLSGPHLGLLHSSNRLVGSALQLVKRLPAVASGGRSVLEMTFSDAKDMRDCYLFKLAQQPVLQLFKHVVLVASPQDKYVGHHSAKIQPCKAAERDAKRWPQYQEMMQHLLRNMGQPGATQLLRVDVDFCFARDYSMGSLVGRTAHVEFVDGDSYVQPLVWGVLQQRGVLQAVPGAWLGDC